MNHKALLLLDVDGPFNPYAAKSNQRPDGYSTSYLSQYGIPSSKRRSRHDTRIWYNPDHGRQLLDLADLGYKLTWATKWNDLANTVWNGSYWDIEPFDVARVPTARERSCKGLGSHYKDCSCLHSKTKVLIEYAGNLPFVWVDDELTDRDVKYAGEHVSQAHHLHYVDPRKGLTKRDFACLKDFISSL